MVNIITEQGELIMITGENRRNEILKMLKEQPTPLSGTALAKAFGVSRQVIVQDIALMRAENHSILSTNKGYLYRSPEVENPQPKRVFYVKHSTDQVLDEFLTMTELGGRVLDVAVEHEIYGYEHDFLKIFKSRKCLWLYRGNAVRNDHLFYCGCLVCFAYCGGLHHSHGLAV